MVVEIKETGVQKETLSPLEVLEQTFEKIKADCFQRSITLPKKVRRRVAYDSDPHVSRSADISYQEFMLIHEGGRLWALGMGAEPSGAPVCGMGFQADVIAIPLGEKLRTDEETTKKLKTKIERLADGEEYFASSLIVASYHFGLSLPEGSWREKMLLALPESSYSPEAQERQIGWGLYDETPTDLTPEVANTLASAIVKVLRYSFH